MTLPYEEPLVVRAPGERVIPEPPRRGEQGGEPCRICAGETTKPVWSDKNWTLHPPVGGSLPGAVWLASRVHVDSFSELPPALASDFGKVAARHRARHPLARRDRPCPSQSMGRWRSALPRLVHPKTPWDARSARNDAADLGGRASERVRRRAAQGGREDRGRDVSVTENGGRSDQSIPLWKEHRTTYTGPLWVTRAATGRTGDESRSAALARAAACCGRGAAHCLG